MKTSLLLLLFIGLCLSSAANNSSRPDAHNSIQQQLAEHIYIPARLIDADSVLVEVLFSITDDYRLQFEEVQGGSRLLQRFLKQQLLEFMANPSVELQVGQKYVLPILIRK